MLTKSLLSLAAFLLALNGGVVPLRAQPVGCSPPIRPFLPSDPRDIQAYSDLLRQDFETYIRDFGAYLRCLDTERARVFQEGQEVTADYGRFQQVMTGQGSVPAD